MKLFRIGILMLFLTVGFLPGCGDNNCNNDDVPRYFDIFGLQVLHTIGTINSFQFIGEGSTVVYPNYRGIQLNVNANFYGQAEQKPIFPFGSLLNTAYACSPASAGYDGSETEMLTNIKVTTIHDFDNEHLAGSEINDLISVRTFEGEIDLSDFINSKQTQLIQLFDLPYLLLPSKAPELSEMFQVNVELSLSTGEVYEARSATVMLLAE